MKEPAGSSKRKRKKTISYYFRVDFTTIQGRLTAGFLSMAVLFFLLVSGTNYQWQLMTNNREYVLDKLRPIKFFSVEVLDKVNETQVVFEKALLFENDKEQYMSEYDAIWLNEVKANRDSLEKYVNRLNDNNATVLFSKLDNQIANLRKEYNQAQKLYSNRNNFLGVTDVNAYLRTYLQSTIVPLVTDLEKNIQDITILIDNLEEKKDQQYADLDYWRPWIVFVQFMLASIIAAIIGSALILNIFKRIRLLRDNLKILAAGNIPKDIQESGDELNTLIRAINELTYNLQVIKDFALDVGNGRFDTEVSVFNQEGELGKSLSEMRQSLKLVYEEESRRIWATEGITKFSNILRNYNDNIALLSKEIISNVVKYLEINQGGLFLLNQPEDQPPFLELKAMYAFDKHKLNEKEIQLGEGLLGQAFLEGEVVHIKKLPDTYAEVTSGLGNAHPKSLLLIPLAYNDETIGMMELASFGDFKEYQITFLQNLAEVIAATIVTVVSNDSTRKLLEESQTKTEAIKLQEEQLRQNAEELVATQEDLAHNLKKVEREMRKLHAIIDYMAYAVMVYNDKGMIELIDKDTAYLFGYSEEEMVGKNINALFVGSDNDSRRGVGDSLTHTFADTQLVEEARKVIGIRKDGSKFQIQINLKKMEWNRDALFIATFSPN
ncbi:MAG: GAF domain-containing protein [Thermonemataceae bacterium]